MTLEKKFLNLLKGNRNIKITESFGYGRRNFIINTLAAANKKPFILCDKALCNIWIDLISKNNIDDFYISSQSLINFSGINKPDFILIIDIEIIHSLVDITTLDSIKKHFERVVHLYNSGDIDLNLEAIILV